MLLQRCIHLYYIEEWNKLNWIELNYGLSFSGFARFSEFWGTINDNLMANFENDSPFEITHKIKGSQPNVMILVLLW